MRWTLMVLLLSGAAIASGQPAPRHLNRWEGVDLEKVVVENGRLQPGDGGIWACPWRFRKTPRGTLIYLARGGWRGWYLNYDHRGKDGRVALVPEPGLGCYWEWTEGPRVKEVDMGEGSVYSIPCRARAMNGPLKGWMLTIAGADVVLVKLPAKELRFTAYVGDQDNSK